MTGLAGKRGSRWTFGARSRRDLVRYLSAVLLVGVAYYVGARMGLTLSLVERNVTPLWPPTGIAVAAFLLGSRSLWPGVAAAAFAVNLPISEGALAAAVTAAGNTLAPLAAAVLLGRVGFRRQLDRRRDALAIVFVGALASTLISATIGAGTLVVSDAIGSDRLLNAWAVWWTGDAMGVLTVAPFLLCLPLFRELPAWSPARWLEAVAILVVAGATITWAAQSELRALYLLPPVVGWAAWRLQLRGAAPTALVVSLVATWSASQADGWFARESVFERMFTLQTFNACIALSSFFLAALVTERNRTAAALEAATVELEDRVETRTAELSAANARLLEEIKERFEAEEQLSQEEARARREHEIAEILQRSLLPDRMPQIPAVALAARYEPATSDVEVGGDWYDVIQLRDGLIGLAIGDVAGHGPSAAAAMGQVRMALRAYAVQDPSPVSVMSGVHRLLSHLAMPEMVTLIYLVFDPATRTLRFTNAGHPPPLIVGGGKSKYLENGLAPPLGVTAEPDYMEYRQTMWAGSTLLLYTDGLVERRRESIQLGLHRLVREALRRQGADVDELCDGILSSLIEMDHVADDVALLAMRPLSVAGRPLALTLPAEPRVLADARRVLRQWLRDSAVTTEDEDEILVACGEACANVVQHAYATAPGSLVLEARIVEGAVEATVRDQGAWRAPAERGGGWGLQLIRGLMDSVDVDRTADGTVVRMRRRLKDAEHGGGG
ncbi:MULTISPECIES: SpoIIE family protein phosphatase [Nocardioides]|uniref:SpoIIE family protein phosphatase n=1 Tax=Nocardioides vastitatis TaxID=2568655 RepID=A0ABW0ZEX0_9ACTN|nr:SpoIIE family protein phosphatase [Nocardioides sp.]THI96902.1 serine/threonine protein phosphatase [Nocardioides sp.]